MFGNSNCYPRANLASSTEVQMAGQAANHEAKVLQKSTNRPWEERSKGKDKGEKGKWKGGKAEGKSTEHDKNKKEKGEGKKKSSSRERTGVHGGASEHPW